MPTYSYRCYDCDHAFDIQQAFTDDSLSECRSCGGRLRKVFSAVGVSFTGSGFYRTDSRADSKSSPSSGSEGSSEASSSNSSSATPGVSAKKEGAAGAGVSTTSSTASRTGAAKESRKSHA